MPERKKIVSLLRVTDCDTGMYEVGELDFCVPVIAVDWLEVKPERRAAVAKELRWLADRCEASEAPFNSLSGDADA